MHDQKDEYVTATEALELLQVSKGKLTAMLKDGELPYYPNPRDKKSKLLKRSDIEAWLATAPPPKKLSEHRRRQPAQENEKTQVAA